MNIKEIKKIKPINKTDASSKQGAFPKVKLDGFYHAVQKTDMLEVVEKIQKERVAKP